MKCIKFYHKGLESNLVEMIGMDSVMPIDGRLNMSSIRAEIQKHIESMKKIESFDPCAFSILTGPTILCASESPVYNL